MAKPIKVLLDPIKNLFFDLSRRLAISVIIIRIPYIIYQYVGLY